MSQPTPEPATAAYRPPGPHDQPHPSETVTPVPALTWRWGVVGGTFAANASGRTYVIGHGQDSWWWATVDGGRMADPEGQTRWGTKGAAQAACSAHVRDTPVGRA